jgi:hypothetical protein
MKLGVLCALCGSSFFFIFEPPRTPSLQRYTHMVAVSYAQTPVSQASSASWKERLKSELDLRFAKITPRKIKSRGKPKIARWEDVDQTLADAAASLNLTPLLREILPSLEARERPETLALRAELDQLLAGQALLYQRLFLIEDPGVYFPLTNNVLRLTGDDSFVDLQVFDKTGFSLGQFVGKYIFEKTGGTTSSSLGYRLTYFQYRDNSGEIRPAGTFNLLDTFVVRWREIQDKPGLVLTADAVLK